MRLCHTHRQSDELRDCRQGHRCALGVHPGQLYEALCYACFFFIGWWFYRHKPERVGTGFFFGLCLVLIFTSRILIEYTKENQVGFEDGMPFNMGQLLSVPFVLLGLYCMLGGRLCRRLGEK